MSFLIWLPLGVELTAKCNSDSLSRMAKDKKSFAKPSSRNPSNAGGHSPSRSRRSDENASHSGYNRFSNSGSSGYNDLNSGGSSAVPVRHIPCIRPPRELIVEIYLFIYLLFCLVLQNLNIYKQNWYLIDYDLLVFSVIVLGRTVLWRVLTWLGRWWSHAQNYKYWIGKGVEFTGKLGIVVMAVHLASELLFSYSLPCCLYLAYPVFLYTSLFGFTLDPHQERLRLYRSYPNSQQCLRVADHSSYYPQSPPSATPPLSESSAKSPANASPALPGVAGSLGNQPDHLRLRRPSSQDSPGSGTYSSSDAAGSRPAQGSPDSRQTSSGVPVQSMGLCNSAFVSPTRSGAQVLTSSLLARTLLPWRSLAPEAVVVVSSCPSVSLSANSSSSSSAAHPLVPSPDWVRQEVECLWADYVVRVKQIFFSSILCAYYAGFLPMQIVKHDQLYFQQLWCWVNTGVILCNSFLLLSFLLLPAHYCGSLYKCAVQLGFWEVQVGQTTAPHTWSAMSSWPRGSVVRHPKGVFRASGSHATVALPGDESHGSFYLLFTWALYIPIWCCAFGLVLLLLQAYCLWKFTDYLQSLSIFVSLVFSLYPYFHLARDSLILSKTALKS